MNEITPSSEFENYSTYKSNYGTYKNRCTQRFVAMMKFDMTVESEKNFIVKKSLRPVPSQGMVEQAKKHGGFRPRE